MDLQNNWSYDLSVQKVSGLVTELKNVTLKKSTLTDAISKRVVCKERTIKVIRR